jgi:hypothetical protein
MGNNVTQMFDDNNKKEIDKEETIFLSPDIIQQKYEPKEFFKKYHSKESYENVSNIICDCMKNKNEIKWKNIIMDNYNTYNNTTG